MSRISNDELRGIADAATPGPWTYEYTRLGHTVRQPDSYRALMVVNHAEHPDADGRLIALAPQLAAEVLELREALQPFASAWNIAHASGNQNLGQLGAIARNEVSAHYFIKAAAALSPAPVVDAVKQGDAQ